MHRPAIVLDNGSGYTKMGFSGNMEPSFVIPTVVALSENASSASELGASLPGHLLSSVAADMDFSIGQEALHAASRGGYSLLRPVQRGQIVDWDAMERFWLRTFYDFLRVDPEEHSVLLSESPMTPPEQREAVAVIMFETFNVQGLHIAPQPVLAFQAANAAAQTPRTGVILDVGEDSVSVSPLVEGYMLPGCIRSAPVGGTHLTQMVKEMIKLRGQDLPTADSESVSQRVKEAFGYACSDVVKEFGKHEKEPTKYQKLWKGKSSNTGAEVQCQVGPERFLAAEALFNSNLMALATRSRDEPSLMREAAELGLRLGGGGQGGEEGREGESARGGEAHRGGGGGGEFLTVPQLLDSSIQSAPIDTKRALYKTIVLSGGSTLFKNFGTRVQRDLRKIVEERQGTGGVPREASFSSGDSPLPNQKQSRTFATSGAVEVSVISHPLQDYAVWFGGSIVASTHSFTELCHTREQYAEVGPSICRASRGSARV